MEIERKYRLTEQQFKKLVPNLDDFALETRYYLYAEDDNEIRITRRENPDDPSYTLDRMELIPTESNEYFVRKKERIVITSKEFDALTKLLGDQQPVERLHYKLNDKIELKVYQGRHAGLIRAEVEFKSIEEAMTYKPGFGHSGEITNTFLGRDVSLISLTTTEIVNREDHATS